MADKDTTSGPNPTAPAAPGAPAAPSANVGANISAVSDKAAEAANKATAVAKDATEKVKSFLSQPSGNVVLIVIAGIAICLVTAYALYYILSTTVIDQTSYTLEESLVPLVGTQVTKLSGDKIPNATNGTRASMSFWIYINDITKFSGIKRHVFHRGKATDTFESAATWVSMDPDSSAITVLFGPTRDDTKYQYAGKVVQTLGSAGATDANTIVRATTNVNTATELNTIKWDMIRQCRGVQIPYIPLQRWVHVAVVVNEDTNGGTLTTYVDAELSKTVTSSTKTTPVPGIKVDATNTYTVTPTPNIQYIDLSQKGDVYTGGSLSDPIGPGFSGLVSKVEYFNYDMNVNDVYADYVKGPVDTSVLGKLGFGVRSPIYRL